MTREESWQVKRTTLMLLRHVTSLGHTVSVFRFASSLLGKPGFVEMHAMDLSAVPPERCMARVVDGEPGGIEYHCACFLAKLVGVTLGDG